MRWSAADVARFAHGAGFRSEDWVTAIAVALATSDGDDRWSWEPHGAPLLARVGLWGVPVPDARLIEPTADLLNPDVNARVAHGLWRELGGWDWAPAFTNGAYAPFLAQARDLTAPGATEPYPNGPAPSAGTAGAVRFAVGAAQRAVGALLDGAAALRSLNR